MRRRIQNSMSALAGAGLGMAVMYLLDPQTGYHRRHVLGKAARRKLASARDTAGAAWGNIASQAGSFAHGLRHRGEEGAEFEEFDDGGREFGGREFGGREHGREEREEFEPIARFHRGGHRGRHHMRGRHRDHGEEEFEGRHFQGRGFRRRGTPMAFAPQQPSFAEYFEEEEPEEEPRHHVRRAARTLGSLALVSGLIWALNPQKGRARRAWLAERSGHFAHDTGEFLKRGAHQVGGSVKGAVARTREHMGRHHEEEHGQPQQQEYAGHEQGEERSEWRQEAQRQPQFLQQRPEPQRAEPQRAEPQRWQPQRQQEQQQPQQQPQRQAYQAYQGQRQQHEEPPAAEPPRREEAQRPEPQRREEPRRAEFTSGAAPKAQPQQPPPKQPQQQPPQRQPQQPEVHQGQGFSMTATTPQDHEREQRERQGGGAVIGGTIDDQALRNRVRSELQRAVKNLGEVEVRANDGYIVLIGELDSDDIETAASYVLAMRGVRGLDNRLRPRATQTSASRGTAGKESASGKSAGIHWMPNQTEPDGGAGPRSRPGHSRSAP